MGIKPLFVIHSEDAFADEILTNNDIKDKVIVNYKEIYKKLDWLKQICKTKDIDFLIFSRNDQVKDRINIGGITKRLKLGYTTVSSLEDDNFEKNTSSMLADLLNMAAKSSKDARTESNPKKIGESKTFSLIFDTEQLGCIKFGVPRLLDVLKKHKIKATFFMTNLVRQIYPEIAAHVVSEGHEIGLHGEYHEFLQEKTKDEQAQKISRMISDIGKITNVHGANFIGRFDEGTLNGMIDNNLEYFVFDAIKKYRYFGYRTAATEPLITKQSHSGRSILAIPIDVETYNYPLGLVKKMVQTSIAQKEKNNSTGQHITILMHPFRDGSLNHIKDTEQLIEFISNLGFKPSRIVDYSSALVKNNLKSLDTDQFCNETQKMQINGFTNMDVIDFIPQWTTRIIKKSSWPKVVF